jgi:PAS domain S-box-containing protein
MKKNASFSARRLLATTTIAIVTVYVLLTYVLPTLWASRRDWVETLAEAVLVGITATIILYLFWYQPLLRELIMHDEVERTLKSLQTQFAAGSEHRGRELADTRHRLETEIQERARLANAIEHASDAIMITDSNGCIMHVNGALERLTGYARPELIGETPQLLRCNDQQPAFDGELARLLPSVRTWRGQLVNSRKDGTRYTAQTVVTPIQKDGTALGSLVLIEHVEPQPPTMGT